jgi:hypothetical protein
LGYFAHRGLKGTKYVTVDYNLSPADCGPAETARAEHSAAIGARLPGPARTGLRRWLTGRRLAALALGLLVLVVHDVGYLLSQAFWTDETWVAATTRFSVSRLPLTTSSTPIGWSLLLRLFTVSGTQVSRLLPLAFAAAAVVIACALGHGIGWRVREAPAVAGLLAGVAVLLAPGLLVRDDLKQYTADACLALLALAVTSRLERDWSRRWLAGLSVTVWGGMLFSDGVALVGIAAFIAVALVQLARRAWRRLAETAVAGAVTAVLMAAVYEAFDARAVLPGLTYSPHFRNVDLPLGQGWHASLSFVHHRLDIAGGNFGLGPLWLAGLLFAAGVVTIFRLGRPATAVALAGLWPEMVVLSALHKYPFLDERTSTFLYAVTAATAAIGVAGVYALLRPRLRGTVAAVVAGAALAAFAAGALPLARGHPIPATHGDIRSQTRYVAAHAGSRDVILVNMSSNWGFAYYWPVGRPSTRPDHAVLQEYEAYFPDQPRIVVAFSRNQAGVRAAVTRAAARAAAQSRPGTCTRIWLVRTHGSAAEDAAWRAALAQRGLAARPVRGSGGLSVVPVGGPGCQLSRRRRRRRRLRRRSQRPPPRLPSSGIRSTVCRSPQAKRARYRGAPSPAVNSVLHRVGASSPACRTAPNRRSTSPTTHPQGRTSATVSRAGGAQPPARTSHSWTIAPPGTAMVSNHRPGHSSSSHWVISQLRSPNSRWAARTGRPSTMR